MSRAKVRQDEYLKGLLKSLKEESDELLSMKERIDEKLEELETKRLTIARTFE